VASAPADDAALEYTRRLYANVLSWYDNADRKAQLILTANGAFLTALTGFGLSRATEVHNTVAVFGPETWLFAALAALAVAASFASAALVLWSRLHSKASAHSVFASHGVKLDDHTTYDPSILWFFQFVQYLDERQLERRLHALVRGDEIDAMADEIIQLAGRVAKKHVWVNVGFASTTVALASLLATVVSYVVRVA